MQTSREVTEKAISVLQHLGHPVGGQVRLEAESLDITICAIIEERMLILDKSVKKSLLNAQQAENDKACRAANAEFALEVRSWFTQTQADLEATLRQALETYIPASQQQAAQIEEIAKKLHDAAQAHRCAAPGNASALREPRRIT